MSARLPGERRSTRLAQRVVDTAAGLIRDPATRTRYREQWQADVAGAAELGLRPGRIALGAATSAVRLSVAGTHPLAGVRATRIGPRARTAVGVLQVVTIAPYLAALALYGYARLRLGVSRADLFGSGDDPKDLIGGYLPGYLGYGLMAVWLALFGALGAAILAPVSLLLSLRARRGTRWLLAGSGLVAVAAADFAFSDFGLSLRDWLLD